MANEHNNLAKQASTDVGVAHHRQIFSHALVGAQREATSLVLAGSFRSSKGTLPLFAHGPFKWRWAFVDQPGFGYVADEPLISHSFKK